MDKSTDDWIIGAELADPEDSLFDNPNHNCTPEDYDAYLIRKQKRSKYGGGIDDSWIPTVHKKKTFVNLTSIAHKHRNLNNAAINNQIQAAESQLTVYNPILQNNTITAPTNSQVYVSNSITTTNIDNTINQNTYTSSTIPTFHNSVAHLLYFAQSQTASTLAAAMYSIMSDIRLEQGKAATIHLPDGAVIELDEHGNYTINDRDAKVVYRANRHRDFNPYINVSDKLEEFIAYCGKLGVTQDEMLALPINLFIMWLVVESARADKIEESDQPLLEGLRQVKKSALNKCDQCGRFMRKILKQRQINHCSTRCFEVACA